MTLAQELLDAAAQASKRREMSWIAKLSKDHRAAVEEARSSWRKMPPGSHISATKLAAVMRERLVGFGYSPPSIKVLQRWLTQGV